MMTKYYKVVAKCGHVGRRRYYEGTFYERAESASQAAANVRQRPRVKHDHKDAILSVVAIDRAEYEQGCAAHANEAYFRCGNVQAQNAAWDEICRGVREEQRFVADELSRSERKQLRRDRIHYVLTKQKQRINSLAWSNTEEWAY